MFDIDILQVQTVVLEDLPGYNLEPLGECPNLEYLVLNSCSILSLEGIFSCSKLKLIHARVSLILITNELKQ